MIPVRGSLRTHESTVEIASWATAVSSALSQALPLSSSRPFASTRRIR